jgi:hypothetical protein
MATRRHKLKLSDWLVEILSKIDKNWSNWPGKNTTRFNV